MAKGTIEPLTCLGRLYAIFLILLEYAAFPKAVLPSRRLMGPVGLTLRVRDSGMSFFFTRKSLSSW